MIDQTDEDVRGLLRDAAEDIHAGHWPGVAPTRSVRRSGRSVAIAVAGTLAAIVVGAVAAVALSNTGPTRDATPTSGPSGSPAPSSAYDGPNCLDTVVALRQGSQSFNLNPYGMETIPTITLVASEPVTIERDGRCAASVSLISRDPSVVSFEADGSVQLRPGSVDVDRIGSACAPDFGSSCRGGAVIVDPVRVIVKLD